MTLLETIQLLIGSGGLLTGLVTLIYFGFKTGRIVQKIEAIDTDLKEFKKEVKEEFVSFKKEVKEEFYIFKKEVKEEFAKVRNEIKSEVASVGGEVLIVRDDLKRIQGDVSDIKERVAFMEAFIFFSEFQAESNNSRSDAAKKMWERRKMKKVEAKGK